MSELAFNLNGDAFDVPPSAVAWRVRKMKNKGAPEVAYGRNGTPLVLPLEADVDDLRAEVGAPGRYRLDPIDDQNKQIANAPAGYVMVHELAAAPAAMPASAPAPLAPLPIANDNVVIEAMRMNAEITRLMVDRFPQMMESAAVLLRAADGAGLPARPGMVADDSDDDDDTDDGDGQPATSRGGGLDVGALLTQAAPFLMALVGGKLDLASMLDWNKAAKKGAAERQASQPARLGSAPVTREAPAAEPTAAQQLQADPNAMQHFVAILGALTPEESQLARAVAAELSPSDQVAWLKEQTSLSVVDATRKVRELLATMGKKGGAS